MKRNYVIFFWHLFSDRDWIRYGCDAMAARGYQVRIVQLSEALEGMAVSHMARRSFSGISGAETPRCREDISPILDQLTSDDLILIAAPVRPCYLWLHLQLGKRKLRYVILTLGRLPQEIPWRLLLGRDNLRAVVVMMRSLRHLGFRLKFHLRLMFELGPDYFRIPPPMLWGQAGWARQLWSTEGVHLWRSETVELESFDVAWARRSEQSKSPITSQAYAVFVDEALCDHPDYYINQSPPPTRRGIYFSGLKKLFASIKRDLGLDTVVALHPKANYKQAELEELFGARPILAGNTPELVRCADLVLLHNSTSICYAVIYRKPILFITNNDIDASWLRPDLDIRSSWLGQPIVNLDDDREDKHLGQEMNTVNERSYRYYEDQFIRSPNAKAGPPAEILADRFEKLAARHK